MDQEPMFKKHEDGRVTHVPCGMELKPEFTHCPRCGKQVIKTMRERGELEELRQWLQSSIKMEAGLRTLAMVMVVDTVLAWTLGEHCEIKRLFEGFADAEREAERRSKE